MLLTFIPAAGDFINAQLLGTPQQYMIGNVIQSQFLSLRDYPTAAALSFMLMAAILVLVADLRARARHRPAHLGMRRHERGDDRRSASARRTSA